MYVKEVSVEIFKCTWKDQLLILPPNQDGFFGQMKITSAPK